MSDRVRKAIGIGGAIGIALSSGAMYLSGADVGEASGIVGLAFAAGAAIAALVNGIKE